MRTALLALALVAHLAACAHASPGETPAPPPPALEASRSTDGFAFEEATIADLQARMTAGTLTSRVLVQAYLDRIAAVDDAGPMLNAVLELNPAALREADARDAERKAGKVRGALHGIPLLLKDNIDATPMATSAGSLALANHRPTQDAFLVQRLRDAGAVILGKTNLSEWANIRSTRSTSGWSARGGQTRNPYALDRNPCGSSSGTGAGISANLAVAGIGTETDGSILCPAAVAGLVGIKPTVGLVSRGGIIPISSSQDTAGPMARSVADAAALLTAIAARDRSDEASASRPPGAHVDYTTHLKPGALAGARIGVLRKSMGKHPATDAITEHAIAAMRSAGATVVDAEIPTAGQWDDAELEVLLHEFKAGLDDYLASTAAPVRTLADVIAFNRDHAAQEMPWFGQELFERALATGPLTDRAYLDARDKARRLAGPQGIDVALRTQRLDALVAPTTSPAWLTDPLTGDHFTGAGYGAAAVARYPSITVPMGDVQGLPVGLAFIGTAWSEPRLVELAHAFEQVTRARRPPRFLRSVTP